jgi:hypothetical protein
VRTSTPSFLNVHNTVSHVPGSSSTTRIAAR